ncbi:ABC transporter substrate-binding protein [Aliicoccus persicus]|uniref:Peptide/nickel transport system substrate-binding protein n=1 Tax=Aliicoccus persicus TaxID=930138 RepID=A0A662Z3C5_9STAP|nr:ABC transporter substrate-binding protein [Aliicoccus persicus]SEV99609.1 peptide/nickel transport system substrate-binding protein [Aliicoccus persicus]
MRLGKMMLTSLGVMLTASLGYSMATSSVDAQEDGVDLDIGLLNEPVSMDPHTANDIPSAQIRTQLYDTLVKQDFDMEIGEGLATDWEQVDDNTWSFTLREGVTFHDGSDFTAEDVEATLERILDPSSASSVRFMFEMITDIESVDEHTLEITTEYPFAPLLSNLSHNTAGILSKDTIDEDYQNALDEAGLDITLDEYYEMRDEGGDEFDDVSAQITEFIGNHLAPNPVGTGHLQFVSRTPGDNIVLEGFDDYYEEGRELGTVTYRVIPENQARLAELETGGIAISDSVDPVNMERVRNADNMDIIDQEGLSMTYLAFNVENELFADVNVRKAISHALDREGMIDGLLDGRGIHGSTHIARTVNFHDESFEEIEYDMELAQEYMAESDQADGFSATLWVSNSDTNRDLAQYMQETLGELKIDITIEEYEFGTFLDMANSGTHDMFMLQWITVTGDADYGLYPMFHTDSQDGSGNRWLYSNPELDTELEGGRQAQDEEERAAFYSEAQRILLEDLPITPLYYSELGIGINTDLVSGVELDPVGIIRLENVTAPE